jgi:hypothetical protein
LMLCLLHIGRSCQMKIYFFSSLDNDMYTDFKADIGMDSS